MTVSIIIPVYNVEPYIIRCLQSVAVQTYNYIECIIVDDCGIDHSMSLAQDFINQYQGPISFSIIRHNQNRGLAAARNSGIKHATGKFLFFLDSDDTIVPNCINLLVSFFNIYPDIQFAQGNFIGEDSCLNSYSFPPDVPEYTNDKTLIDRLMLCNIVTSSCNRLLSRDFIIDNNLYFPEGILHEDLYWVYYTAKCTTAAAFTYEGLYVYYRNENSIVTSTSNKTRIKRYLSRLYGANDYFEDLISNGSNLYQRQFFAVNLTCCLVELSEINSIYHWNKFWYTIIKYSLRSIRKITWNRFLFFCCLMPPICFWGNRKNVRWKIQNDILARI